MDQYGKPGAGLEAELTVIPGDSAADALNGSV